MLWRPDSRVWKPRRGSLGLGLGLSLRQHGRAAAAPNPLLTDLAAYYKLEEASGAAVDASPNGLDLTAVNNPLGATGKVGDGRALVRASSQRLERATMTGLSNPTHIWFSAWVKHNSVAEVDVISLLNDNSGAPVSVFFLTMSPLSGGGPHFRGFFRQTNGTFIGVEDTTNDPVTAGAWYLVNLWWDGTLNRVGLKINDSPTTHSATGLALRTCVNPTMVLGNSGATYMDGTQDEVGVWTRIPTADDLAALWNDGNGMTLFP